MSLRAAEQYVGIANRLLTKLAAQLRTRAHSRGQQVTKRPDHKDYCALIRTAPEGHWEVEGLVPARAWGFESPSDTASELGIWPQARAAAQANRSRRPIANRDAWSSPVRGHFKKRGERLTDAYGTSTTQVFTGQTVSLNGGPEAEESQEVSISP